MANSILSKNSDVVLSCHQGLSAEEITYDCLEKAKALTAVGFGYLMSGSKENLPAAYLSVLDDVLELGLKYGALADSISPLILVK
jgi:hypothetical protein